AQLLIQRVELLTRHCVDRARDAQILAVLAGFHFHCRAIKVRRVPPHNFEHRLRESRAGRAHDLERKLAWVLDQRRVLPVGHAAYAARRITVCLNSWYSGCMRRNSGPGLPSPTGSSSSVVTASTSLVDDVTQISSAVRTSCSDTSRSSSGILWAFAISITTS